MKRLSIVPFAAVAASFCLAGAAEAQSLWKQGSRMSNLIADRTAHQVGDIVRILISEQQTVQDKNNTKIERTSSTVATPKKFQLTRHVPVDLPEIEIEGSRKMDAKADAQKSGLFSTEISALVIDVLPNGNLLVNGRRRIFIDQDEKTIEITGIVRPYDIGTDNSIKSNQIAEARITFINDGPIAEASKKGWLARAWDKFWNFIWPF